jgi:hypothetical protein
VCMQRQQQQQGHSITGRYYYPYRKENDCANDLCSSCFQLTYLQDTYFTVYML